MFSSASIRTSFIRVRCASSLVLNRYVVRSKCSEVYFVDSEFLPVLFNASFLFLQNGKDQYNTCTYLHSFLRKLHVLSLFLLQVISFCKYIRIPDTNTNIKYVMGRHHV